ncbi:hypothetical protein K469DRAFT_712122 [Zopfia rhizophila CBS 207.26]|uniref:Copper-fist domain-containing protein n=1 Tax=Zopfia rhizophila CBS 207.26 TaxID=1314779 RepID=A0A6A6EQR5_9PEZI|nr:hypothetical protein K469DRAFT_712122 [Zopfia rhizophila CBS 207.26]
MPVINGEKWACSSCIKGHRVSGCTHNDRELIHINPKGRPVKQCEHCRVARKSKSHHAKCDCGEKKDKIKNKDKVGAKVDENSCCCYSGAICICGLKKDSLDLKLDTGKHMLHGARAKPKLTSTHSESTLTVFANGHHKPCHRNNNSAHVSGAPYKIPRPHTLHGSAAFASYSNDGVYGRSEASAQRSMDTLSLSNNDFYAMFGSAQHSVDSLPITPLTGALDQTGFQDSLFTSQSSTTYGQEGNSPSESHLSDTFSPQQWPWPSSVNSLNRNFGYGSLSTSPSQDCLPNLENGLAIPSAGLNNPLWSAGDLPLDPNKLSDSLTQPISHSGESNQHSAPGLTTGSSAQSEVGEPALFGDLPQSAVSETLFWEDTPALRLATSGPPPTSMPAVDEDRRSVDVDFTKRMNNGSPFESEVNFTSNPLAFSSPSVDEENTSSTMVGTSVNDGCTTYSTADYSEPRAIVIPNNIEDVVSNDPWLMDQSNAFNGLNGLDVSFPKWT